MDHANTPTLTPADRIIGALAFAAGSADVFAFLKLHDVFTSAMTGNTALLGLALGRGHLLDAARSLAALAGFAIGSGAATLLHDKTASPAIQVHRLLLVESVCLIGVAVLWAVLPHPVYHAPLFVLILLAAGAMGVQSVAARAIDLPGIPTVVFTTTLTMIMMGVIRALRPGTPSGGLKPITWRQIGAMSLYLVGAATSAALTNGWPAVIALPPMIAVLLALQTARLVRSRA
ncbi:MAG: DUF1275 domain-containing protein [Proteobacteria bacterium]|nr:DUF1275 domain-containing protein [Pseudomonadota bacterium]